MKSAILILLVTALSFSQSALNTDVKTKAYRAHLEGQNAIAAFKFQELAFSEGQKYQLKSVFSWLDLAPTSPEYYLKARYALDSLLVQLEPEDSLYFPSLLTRVWVLHKAGQSDSSKIFLEESSEHLTRNEHNLYLWMQFHVLFEDQQDKALKARQELIKLYPNSATAQSIIALGEPTLSAPKEKTPTTPVKGTSATTTSTSGIQIQLGAFSSKENGDRAISNIGELPAGFEPFLLHDEKRKLYLFRVKGFESKKQAHQFAAEELRLERGQYLVLKSQ